MKLTSEQMTWLLAKMVEVAEAVLEDHEYRHSDYGGMCVYRIKDKVEESLNEFNTLDEEVE